MAEVYQRNPPPYTINTPSVGPRSGQALGPHPNTVVCPNCRERVITETRYEITTSTHMIALLLCLIGCWPCACIPYCSDSCQNIKHHCPKCKACLGTFQN